MTMADTVAVMNAGQIEQMGPPAELYDLPRTAFVANFLGQSNLMRGRVADSGSDSASVVIDSPAGRVVVPRERATAATGSVVVGVRPEKVRIRRAEESGQLSGNSIGPCPVIDVSFSGVSTQYIVEVPGAGPWTVFAQNLEIAQAAHLGDQVMLNWDPRHTFTLAGDEDLLAGVSPDLAEVTG